MPVNQGAIAIKLWFGSSPRHQIMRRAVLSDDPLGILIAPSRADESPPRCRDCATLASHFYKASEGKSDRRNNFCSVYFR